MCRRRIGNTGDTARAYVNGARTVRINNNVSVRRTSNSVTVYVKVTTKLRRRIRQQVKGNRTFRNGNKAKLLVYFKDRVIGLVTANAELTVVISNSSPDFTVVRFSNLTGFIRNTTILRQCGVVSTGTNILHGVTARSDHRTQEERHSSVVSNSTIQTKVVRTVIRIRTANSNSPAITTFAIRIRGSRQDRISNTVNFHKHVTCRTLRVTEPSSPSCWLVNVKTSSTVVGSTVYVRRKDSTGRTTISNQRTITKVSGRSSKVSLTTIQTLDMISVEESVATSDLGVTVVSNKDTRTIQCHVGVTISHHRPQGTIGVGRCTVDQQTTASRSGVSVTSLTTTRTVRPQVIVVNLRVREVSTILDVRRFGNKCIIVECKVPTLISRQNSVKRVTSTRTSLHTGKRQVSDVRTAVQLKQVVEFSCRGRMHNAATHCLTNNRNVTTFDLDRCNFLVSPSGDNNNLSITITSYSDLKTRTTTTKVSIVGRQNVTNVVVLKSRGVVNSHRSDDTRGVDNDVSSQTSTSTASQRDTIIGAFYVTRTTVGDLNVNLCVDLVNSSTDSSLRSTNTVTSVVVITRSLVHINNTRLFGKRTTRGNSSPTSTVVNRQRKVVIILKPGLTNFPVSSSTRVVGLNKGIETLSCCNSSKEVIVGFSSTRILLSFRNDVLSFDAININRTCTNTKSGLPTAGRFGQTSSINKDVTSDGIINYIINLSRGSNGVIIICPRFSRRNDSIRINLGKSQITIFNAKSNGTITIIGYRNTAAISTNIISNSIINFSSNTILNGKRSADGIVITWPAFSAGNSFCYFILETLIQGSSGSDSCIITAPGVSRVQGVVKTIPIVLL